MLHRNFSHLQSFNFGLRNRAWMTVLVMYVLIFGGLLVATGGLPYVVDNNESFSSLIHAQNLASFDFGRSFGLTDESYAVTEEGHPYIHSHQGNFPRVFAFIIYVLGARSIESQIWVTTFTVGLAAIWLAFRFTQRVGGPLLAAAACMIMMTDYVLFSQWHVNTYRVWHAFFFFSCLESVHLATSQRPRLGWILATLNFACLFYWEYVFAAFVGLLTALYALHAHWERWRALAHTWTAGLVGAAIAAGTLLAQLTAYMGWENVLLDIRYTLVARNSAFDSALAAEINAFYDKHNILFWQNFVDVSNLRTWTAAWEGLVAHHWLYANPSVVGVGFVFIAAWALAHFPLLEPPKPARAARFGSLVDRIGRAIALALVIGLAVEGAKHWTAPTGLPAEEGMFAWKRFILPPLLALACCLVWFRRLSGFSRLGWLRLFFAGGFFAAVGAAANLFRPPNLAPLIEKIQAASGPFGSGALNIVLTTGVFLLGLSLIVLGPAQILGRTSRLKPGPTIWFALIVIGAAIPIYRVFTGYIFSGYLYRQAPFWVFATDLLLAVPIALVLSAAVVLWKRDRVHLLFAGAALKPRRVLTFAGASRTEIRRRFPRSFTGSLPFVATAALAFGLTAGWLTLQGRLVGTVPPNNYRFIKTLSDRPYVGSSFAVNTYAAPVSVSTGSWAYFESTLFSGQLTLDRNGWQVPLDEQYLWLADREINRTYKKPNYALTIIQPAGVQESLYRDGVRDSSARAEANGLVRRSRELFQPFLRHRLVESDRDLFSIVKLDWDFPPYLRPADGEFKALASRLTLRQKLKLSETAHETRRRWRLSVEPLEENISPTAEPATVDVLDLSINGRSMSWDSPATKESPWSQLAIGDQVQMRLATGPEAGTARVVVNDVEELIDLHTATPGELTLEWSSAQPYGKYTSVPVFPPGYYVQTRVFRERGQPVANVSYEFIHQEGQPEEASVVRIYQQLSTGRWRLADTIHLLGPDGIRVRMNDFIAGNPDTVEEHARIVASGDPRTYLQWLSDHLAMNRQEWGRSGLLDISRPSGDNAFAGDSRRTRVIPLPADAKGVLQISVVPATRTKSGPEYFGLPFAIQEASNRTPADIEMEPPEIEPGRPLPFGSLKMKVRFPRNRWPQAEPLLSTGRNEAGDFVYVIYPDEAHIRIGFDHWFKGGPLTAPIPIDFDQDHELEISIGSLYPPADDIVFAGVPTRQVAEVKRRVLVKLNGETVIDSVADSYEATPDQVIIGANRISGTSSGPRFSGQILSVERTWPWSP